MKRENLELKVGFFVLVALALLGVLIFKAGDFYLKPGYGIRLIFDSVNGVEQGSPVHLSGVPVGKITQVRVIKDAEGLTRAEVAARIDQGIFIEEDSYARISSLGFLGEKFVEIVPGTSGAKGLGPGSVLIGRRAVAMDSLTESGTRLIEKIELTFDSVNNVVADQQFQTSLKNTFVKANGTFTNAEVMVVNLREATEDLKDAAKSARIVLGRLRDGEGTVGRLLKDDKMAKDLEAFAADIKAHPWKLLKRN
jgi:phospholipid/cholesterol/gamma-HCH transport system substrate-binding protein